MRYKLTKESFYASLRGIAMMPVDILTTKSKYLSMKRDE